MLIDKEVEVNLALNNIKYYENLGYYIPRKITKSNKLVVPIGTKIIVKVYDLPKHSGVYVKIMCDYCNKEYYVKYQEYQRKQNDNNKIKSKFMD